MAVKQSESERSRNDAEVAREASALQGSVSTSGAAGGREPTKPEDDAAVALCVSPWTAAAFFTGLALVYFGERILVGSALLARIGTVLGVLLAAGSTAARFVGSRGPRDRTSIARLLGALQAVGLLGLLLYFASTLGQSWFGSQEGASEPMLGVLQVTWVCCLALSSGAVLFAEFALHPMRTAALLEWRRVRAAATSGASLMLAGSYCALLVYSAAQQEAQADFSYFKTSEPGDATVKLVEQMTDPVTVTAFFPQVNEVRDEVEKYLRRLASQSSNFEYAVVDRYAEPKRANELRVVRDGTIVLSRGDSREKLTISTTIDQARSRLRELDKDFNAKLMKLLRAKRTAYLTSGHGELNDSRTGKARERSAEIFEKLLEQQNFRIEQLSIANGLAQAVPKDADIVVVLGPTLPFAPEEVASLRRYVEAGGELFMALDVDAVPSDDALAVTAAANVVNATAPADAEGVGAREVSNSPAGSAREETAAPPTAAERAWVTELAEVVGVQLVPTVLADERQHVVRRNQPSDRIILPTDRFSSHASVSTLSRGAAQGVVVLGAGHFLTSENGDVRTDVTVRTAATTFADHNRNYKLDGDEKVQIHNLGLAVSRQLQGDLETPESADTDGAEQAVKRVDREMRAFLFADADVFSDLLMARVVGNQMLAFDAIRWLVGEESLAGEIESEQDVRVETSKQVDLVWFYSTIFGVPALVLGSGVALSRRTRRKGGSKA